MPLNLSVLNHYVAVQSPLHIDPGGPVERGAGVFHLGDAVSLNPQPLPPKASPLNLGDAVSINPQPLPPEYMLQNSALNPGLLVSLNPQPLPPGPPPESPLNLWDVSAVLHSAGSSILQWFHPPIPDPGPVEAGLAQY